MLRVYPPPYFWVLHVDGSAKPNPGRMTAGVTLWAPHGAQWLLSHACSSTGCNNEAELHALQLGVQLALQHGAVALRIYTDSRWLVEQLGQQGALWMASGALQHPAMLPVPRTTERLRPLLQAAHTQLQGVQEVQWRWVPRHCNTQADALARDAQVASATHEKTERPAHAG